MLIAKPPLEDLDQVEELGGVTNRATRTRKFSDNNGNMALTDTTEEGVDVAIYHSLLPEKPDAGS